ncbi:MAG: MerR family transcriptional regulator, light-induced transcriptional regulator, partial [Solirubrobacteraceae bacterium]|nr:MerR family transcriptional regulator, light-induced transcriptional regulator [Solirubrobacteraceae bacterium]
MPHAAVAVSESRAPHAPLRVAPAPQPTKEQDPGSEGVQFPPVAFASAPASTDDVGMRTLKTSEAAALLNVSPNTLRAWERRFGYPKPQRSAGRHRLYTHGEVAALRDALQQGLSISSAVSRAREALSTDTHTLVGALAGFELDRADSAMESALALRSVERAVEEVLLPSLEELGERFGTDSAPWAFAARWADGWLRRAQRLAPPPVRRLAILVGDATGSELAPDALAVRALELFCGRSG